MQFHFINAIDCLALSCFLYLIIDFRDRRRRGGLPYPPGPPLRPIVGNLLHIPKDTPWIAYTDMSKKYGRRDFLSWEHGTSHLNPASQGNIICLRGLSEVVVVLCSYSAIKDLLEKRGEIYSDRPLFPILEMYVLFRN